MMVGLLLLKLQHGVMDRLMDGPDHAYYHT